MKKGNIIFIILFVLSLSAFGVYLLGVFQSRSGYSPTISINEEIITISVKDGESALLQGVTAFDKEDGNVSASLVVESVSDFDEDMTRTVTYAAFDSDNRVKKAQRKIKYSDYSSPEYSLKAPINVTTWDDATIISSITATDVLDGDISTLVTIADYELIDSYSGLYYIDFTVENSAGDVATVKTAVTYAVVSKNLPIISLTDYIVYLDEGETFSPGKYVSAVNYPVGNGNGEVVSSGEVDTGTKGCYIVEYSAESDNGYVGYAYLTVVVR